MAQTSSQGGAGRGGMGSLFAGFMAGWDGVGKIFDDVDLIRKNRDIKEQGAKQEAFEKGQKNAGDPKLSTALLDAPDTPGTVTTTSTGTTPYTGSKLAIPIGPTDAAAPAGGPSGTTTAAPTLKTGLPAPSGKDVGYPFPTQGATAVYPALPSTNLAAWNADPLTSGPGFPDQGSTSLTGGFPTTNVQGQNTGMLATLPPPRGGSPPPAAAAAPTAPAATPETPSPSQDYGGGGDPPSKVPSFGAPPTQPQSQVTPTAEAALPTGLGTTIGARAPYDASLGQSLLGLGPTAGRRRGGLAAVDYAPDQQQAIATAPPMAQRPRPRLAQQQVIPALLPQVDIFGNPIMPVRNV